MPVTEEQESALHAQLGGKFEALDSPVSSATHGQVPRKASVPCTGTGIGTGRAPAPLIKRRVVGRRGRGAARRTADFPGRRHLTQLGHRRTRQAIADRLRPLNP